MADTTRTCGRHGTNDYTLQVFGLFSSKSRKYIPLWLTGAKTKKCYDFWMAKHVKVSIRHRHRQIEIWHNASGSWRPLAAGSAGSPCETDLKHSINLKAFDNMCAKLKGSWGWSFDSILFLHPLRRKIVVPRRMKSHKMLTTPKWPTIGRPGLCDTHTYVLTNAMAVRR